MRYVLWLICKENYDYDLFLSHRQVNGGDLVCAIKLQLEVMFPERHIRSFLDVDDLNNIHILEVFRVFFKGL
jgi:hypothetical protein